MEKNLWSVREEHLRQELRKLRKAAGLTQVELSKKLGIHQSFVSKYESGERQLKFQELELICEACNTSLHTFAKKFRDKHPLKDIFLR